VSRVQDAWFRVQEERLRPGWRKFVALRAVQGEEFRGSGAVYTPAPHVYSISRFRSGWRVQVLRVNSYFREKVLGFSVLGLGDTPAAHVSRSD